LPPSAGSQLVRSLKVGALDTERLVEEVWLLLGDEVPEGLELEPAGLVGADEVASGASVFLGDELGVAGGFGEELRVAAAVHGNEPPDGFVHGFADCE